MVTTWIYVALGGALGALARYAVTGFVAFPFGTLGVNILGSFAIGLIWVQFLDKPQMLAFAMTGLLGGFTTFSAFSLDTLRLVEDGRAVSAIGYVICSVALSCLGCAVALWLARGGNA